MRVIYTEEALENLDGILAYIASNYPTVYEAFQIRLQSVVNVSANGPTALRKSQNGQG